MIIPTIKEMDSFPIVARAPIFERSAQTPSNPGPDFDQKPFTLHHSLHRNPLFRLPALMELERRLRPNIYYDTSTVSIDDRWDKLPRSEQTPQQALADIESGNTWLVVRNAQQVSEYGLVLDQSLEEIERLVGFPFREGMRNQEMIIFVTSPRRIATYHIDRECSFLLQLQGEKTIHIFDRNDRDVLPDKEIEDFWTIDNNAPRYRPQLQDRARSYHLVPGDAVHIPVNWPHWVQNHDNVSISVNVNIQFADSVRADVYRANYFLRKLGITPRPPGRSKQLDSAKGYAYSAARTGMRLCGKRLP